MGQRKRKINADTEKLKNKGRSLRTFKSDDFCFFLAIQCDLVCYENMMRIAKSERQFKQRTVKCLKQMQEGMEVATDQKQVKGIVTFKLIPI